MSGLDEKGLEARITDYLSSGGLFNPEMANHEAVRDLLIDCRAYLAASAPPAPDGLEPVAWQWRGLEVGEAPTPWMFENEDVFRTWKVAVGRAPQKYSIERRALVPAATLSAQEAEIERLRKELAEEQETWPRWAAEICKCLRGYGVDPGDEEGWDLPAQFEDWVRGVVENETARAESAEAEVARLRKVVERAKEVIEPFADFGVNNTDADGWGGTRCEGERIRDWFGPSEFRAARQFAEEVKS